MGNYYYIMAKTISKAKRAPKVAPAKVGKRPTVLKFSFLGAIWGKNWANVKLLWSKAPKTCAAIVGSLNKKGEMKVKSVHGRNSGSEALFLTPTVLPIGDENTILNYKTGDVCFGFEPKGCCSHGAVDASEVAWIYKNDAQPRRWVSINGDPTN